MYLGSHFQRPYLWLPLSRQKYIFFSQYIFSPAILLFNFPCNYKKKLSIRGNRFDQTSLPSLSTEQQVGNSKSGSKISILRTCDQPTNHPTIPSNPILELMHTFWITAIFYNLFSPHAMNSLGSAKLL